MNNDYLELKRAVERVEAVVELKAEGDGQSPRTLRLVGRRLTGAEARILESKRMEVLAPVNPETKELDFRDPKYLEKSGEMDSVVRAMAVYWCFKDCFERQGLTEPREILAEVESHPVGLIDLLHGMLENNPVSKVRMVNFFSPAPAHGS